MGNRERNANSRPDSSPSAASADTPPEISPTGRTRPIPDACKHIEVNFCKTPGCENFGVPPRKGPIINGPGTKGQDRYKVAGHGKGTSALICAACGKGTRLKNNLAVHEEFERQSAYLFVPHPLSCPDASCINHRPTRESLKTAFRKYGKTKSGSDRWQCRECKKTFALGKPTVGHKKPHINIRAFELIVNKVPLNRMAEILDVSYSTLYGKIDFIYEQCRLFAASREAQLRQMEFKRLYLSTDRQDYLVNWGDRSARKTIQLTAVATADQRSGYIFGLTPNFDASVDPAEIEQRWTNERESSKRPQMRSLARVWTEFDYRLSAARAGRLGEDSGASSRDDLDAPELLDLGQQLPKNGVQVHADYLMHGHYWFLRSLTHGAEKLRFYIDQDAGLLHACLGAFADKVLNRQADVVQVDIQKNLTIDQRKNAHGKAKRWFEGERARFPDIKDNVIRTAILAERIAAAREASKAEKGKLQDVWLEYPFPDMAEPGKKLRFVTDLDDYDDHHVANLLMKGSLWPVDTVFNRIRRRMVMFERPVQSVRRARRMWHIYAPYDAAMVEKMLTIFRVWHNYVWVDGKAKKTAAEKLGMAEGKVRMQDIVYFDVRSKI